MKVFLGGTCNGSMWREELIPLLNMDYFNPVVKDWTPECQAEELKQREECDFCLYVITPRMTGVYSIAEAVDDSNKRPDKTLFCFVDDNGFDLFTNGSTKSLMAVGEMIRRNGGLWCKDLESVANALNTFEHNAKKLENEVLEKGWL